MRLHLRQGALHTLGCEAVRDVKPGEVVLLLNSALKVMQAVEPIMPTRYF